MELCYLALQLKKVRSQCVTKAILKEDIKITSQMILFSKFLGESVEENANLVVRLLIRRPECLGPALRGEGGGLLKAMRDGIKMSEQIAASRDGTSGHFLSAMNDEDDSGGKYLYQS